MPRGVYPRKRRAASGTTERIAGEVAIQRASGMKWSDIAAHHKVHEVTAMKALKLARHPSNAAMLRTAIRNASTKPASTPAPTQPAAQTPPARIPTSISVPSTVIVKIPATNLSLEGATAISSDEKEAIIKVARLLRKHGIDARVLADVE